MTGFDVFAILAVLVSALIGYARGAVREVVTLCAFGLAAVAAIAFLPFFAPLLRHVIHPGWAAAVAAVVIVFILAYVLVRTGGGMLTTRLHGSRLRGVDRWGGAGFGVLRGLIFLGLAGLLIATVPWPGGPPRWITGGLTWPLTSGAGRTLAALAPAGGGAAGRFGRFFKQGVDAGFQPSIDEATDQNAPDQNATADNATGEGARGVILQSSDGDTTPRRTAGARAREAAGRYTRRTRDDVDTVVERSR